MSEDGLTAALAGHAVTRTPEHDGYDELGGPDEVGEDYLLQLDGRQIGGTYWCGGVDTPAGQRWASWGVAGLSMGHPSREAAEAVQVDAALSRPVKPADR